MEPFPQTSALAEVKEGFRDISPLIVSLVPIGVLFGALGASKGLTAAEIALMSATVFAGGAQFAAIEIWRVPAPILFLAFSTLLINIRHVLMGTSLMPKTRFFSPLQRLLGFAVMADENWALSERRAAVRPLSPAYFFAMGGALWATWVVCATAGCLGGSMLGDPRRFGADFAFPAVFIGLVAGFWKGPSTAVTIAASGGVAALVYLTLGPPWHVALGALAGISAAYLVAAPRRSAPRRSTPRRSTP